MLKKIKRSQFKRLYHICIPLHICIPMPGAGDIASLDSCYFNHINTETEQDTVGPLGREVFLCPPPFLVFREQTPSSMTFPGPQRADSNSCSSGKWGRGMQRQGRSSQETIVQPWGKVLVLPQGIYITISLSSLQNQNPQKMKLAFSIPKETTWGQIKGTREAHQEIQCTEAEFLASIVNLITIFFPNGTEFSIPVIPNLFGTRDKFHGRKFFHGWWGVWLFRQ